MTLEPALRTRDRWHGARAQAASAKGEVTMAHQTLSATADDGTTVIVHRASIYDARGHKQKSWVVQWQTPRMPAPSFWYYATADMAEKVARSLLSERQMSSQRTDPAVHCHSCGAHLADPRPRELRAWRASRRKGG